MFILELMNLKDTAKTLQRIYYWQLIPAAILLVMAYALTFIFHLADQNLSASKTVTIVVTVLSGVIGIAMPVFYRSYFVYKIKDQKKIAEDAFLNYERTQITLALLTPYFLIIAVLMSMNQTALILITLFSIYVLYYYFPSEKKVHFEMKIFRIKPE